MAKDRKDLQTLEIPGMETRQTNETRRRHETAIQKAAQQAKIRQDLQAEHQQDKSRKRRRRHAWRLAPLDAAEQG